MSPRVTLVPVAPAHAAAVQALAADPRVTATTNLPEPYPPDGAAGFITYIVPRHAAGLEYAFAILAAPDAGTEDAPHTTVVGMCGLVMPSDPSAHDAAAELGYWIGTPYWGRGYATAAARAAVDVAFRETGLRIVDAFPLLDNAPSRRVLEKAGAIYVGELPNRYPKWPHDRHLARYRFTRAF